MAGSQLAVKSPDFPAASALVKDVSGLVSPPDVCLRVMDLMRSSTATTRDFGEVMTVERPR